MEKVKNLPVMRLAAFAVAVAIILGLSSAMLSFTANAAAVDNVNALNLSAHQLGTLGSYPVIGIPTSGLLADYISTSDESGSMSMRDYFLPFVVFNGDIYYYNRLVYIGYHKIYFDKFPNCALAFYGQCNFSPIYDSLKSGNTSPSKKFDYRNFSFSESGNTLTVTNSEYPSNTWTVTYEFKSASGVTLSSSNVNRILFARVKTCLSTDDTVDVSDLSPYINSSDTYKDIDSGTSPTAEFVTCASYTSDDNSIPLWFKDFTSEGQQYPLFTYYIHDNGNKHSYSLKLSYSSSAKDDVKKVFNLRENTKEDTDAAIKDVVERIVAMYAIHGVKMHDLTPYLRTALNLKFPNNLTYNQAFVLSSPEMDFSATGNNKVYTICLSDYSDIIQCLIYKAEIIDNNTGLVLDTTYFTSKQTFNKGNSGFGSKVYDYDNRYDDMINDIKNNTPSVEPDNKGDFVADGDIIQTGRYDYYTGLKIDDIFNTLEASASSLRSFFLMCMNIIPAGILAIILGGLSIVIILRILGR